MHALFDPFLQFQELHPVHLVRGQVRDAQAGTPVEFVHQVVELLCALARLLDAFLGDPGGSFHELGSLEITALCDGLDGTQPLFKELVLLGEHSPLPLSLVVGKHVLDGHPGEVQSAECVPRQGAEGNGVGIQLAEEEDRGATAPHRQPLRDPKGAESQFDTVRWRWPRCHDAKGTGGIAEE